MPGNLPSKEPNNKTQPQHRYDASLAGKKVTRFGFKTKLPKLQSLNNSPKQLQTKRSALGRK